jgi:rubrerythrin
VAGKFSEGEIKDLFSRLCDWEQGHIRKFEEIRDAVDETEPTDSYPGELQNYMQALVDERLYDEVSPQNFGKAIKTPVDAIQRGIGFEKDAILFFRELLPFMASPRKDAIEKLVAEEKQHLVYLSELKRKFAG